MQCSKEPRLFDHLIGASDEREWESETERFGRLEVENQFDFRGLQDRHVRGPLAFENSPGVGSGQAVRPRRRQDRTPSGHRPPQTRARKSRVARSGACAGGY